ncbi:uncharacterized protein LOC133189182 [Saccostrea echinata]|uniref:uncharacterized protein LOC133189182 n=1 Tax=Saccostrea echinata TaxID=191078 RepID=UPI002A805650|nr:uncharacterized protein LOC133189182 [Saccostrea echinata]
MASVSRKRPNSRSGDSSPDKIRKPEKDTSKKDNILQKFEDWFHQKHGAINVRHLYMGDACSSTEKIEKGTRVIVSVIESEKAIENEEYQCDREHFTVVYKLWGENSVSEETEEYEEHGHEKIKEITKYLKKNADSIFRKHSNLEMIRASRFRIKKNKAKKKKAIFEPCIAIYCSYKGVVPVGEEEFPTKLDGFATDIREGFFHLHGNYDICANSIDQLDPLRMGASISRESGGGGQGTLGGFVQLNDGEIGFITCAHVLHTADEMLRNPSNLQFPVVQPSLCYEGSQRCGNIFKSAFPSSTIVDGVSVDAAVVKLTNRIPKKALLSDLTTARLKKLGFSRSMLPKFCCGKIRSGEESQDHPHEGVLKCGMVSGLTLGKVEQGEIFARYRNIPLYDDQQRISTMYMSQLVIRGIRNTPFSLKGDSGALVFQYSDVNDLRCIGMIVGGGGEEGLSYATPITSVLEALSVTLKDF